MVATRTEVCAEILRMITGADETSSVRIRPAWEKQAPAYLQDCLRLFPENHARHLLCVRFCGLIDALSDGSAREGQECQALLNENDGDAIVVALSILALNDDEYSSRFRFCMRERMSRFFRDIPPGQKGTEERYLAMVKKLKEPLSLPPADACAIVEFVRGLPDADRDRRLEVRLLARLVEHAKGFSSDSLWKPLDKVSGSTDAKGVTLAFDLLQVFCREVDYENAVILRVADSCVDLLLTASDHKSASDTANSHRQFVGALLEDDTHDATFAEYVLAGLKSHIPTLTSEKDRLWFASVLTALFADDENIENALRAMRDIAGIESITAEGWRETAFHICSTSTPQQNAVVYLNKMWGKAATGGGPKPETAPAPDIFSGDPFSGSEVSRELQKDMPEDVIKLTGAVRRLSRESVDSFHDAFFNYAARGITGLLDAEDNAAERHAWCLRRVLWLSCLLPQNDDPRRRLARELSKYTVIQKNEARHYVSHVKACLACLLIPNAPAPRKTARCREAARLIRSLHENDSMRSSPATETRTAVAENFRIIRETILPIIEEEMMP